MGGRLKGISDLIITASPHPGDPAASISLSVPFSPALPHLVTSLPFSLSSPIHLSSNSRLLGFSLCIPSLALMPCWWSRNREYSMIISRRREGLNISKQPQPRGDLFFKKKQKNNHKINKDRQVWNEFELAPPTIASSYSVRAQITSVCVGTHRVRAATHFDRIQGRASLRPAGVSGYNLLGQQARTILR